ncbi:hypothetical protein Dimus_026967 [Dionaea muscipula]
MFGHLHPFTRPPRRHRRHHCLLGRQPNLCLLGGNRLLGGPQAQACSATSSSSSIAGLFGIIISFACSAVSSIGSLLGGQLPIKTLDPHQIQGELFTLLAGISCSAADHRRLLDADLALPARPSSDSLLVSSSFVACCLFGPFSPFATH